jgi:hypothetical protein
VTSFIDNSFKQRAARTRLASVEVQTAAKLVLEPIFEADLEHASNITRCRSFARSTTFNNGVLKSRGLWQGGDHTRLEVAKNKAGPISLSPVDRAAALKRVDLPASGRTSGVVCCSRRQISLFQVDDQSVLVIEDIYNDL